MKWWAGLLTLVLTFFAATARAETRRVAVVVGNNAGSGAQPALRYAETDAGKVARVLMELGGVDPADLFLLQGRDQAALRAAMNAASARVAAKLKNPADRVMVIFYFSGHSDGLSLEQGPDRMGYADVRQWLGSTGAHVRLTVIDACKSGAFLKSKGGTPGPAFQIHLADELATSGDATLTSSAADEVALESSEIGGSFFTHHFVSGLRGAADASGDGLVTLAEAYAYAFTRTLRTTSSTMVGAQHPSYDSRLSGQGELVLSELLRPLATIELPTELDRAIVVHLARDQVMAEVTSDAARRLALVPGRYSVRVWRKDQSAAAAFTLAPGETRKVAWSDLAPVATGTAVRSKGDDDAQTPAGNTHESRGLQLAGFGAFGLQRGASSDSGIMPSIRAGIRSSRPSGPSLAVMGATGARQGFDESMALGLIGYRVGVRRGALQGSLGLEAGGGFALQHVDSQGTRVTGIVAGGPTLGGALHLGDSWAVLIDGSLLVLGLRRDGGTAAVVNPGAWLGVEWRP